MTGKEKKDSAESIRQIIEKSDVPPSGQRIPMPNVKPPADSSKEDEAKPSKMDPE